MADAGDDQSVAEGALVTLYGEDSFDIDNDPFSYSWVQVSGEPGDLIGEIPPIQPLRLPSADLGATRRRRDTRFRADGR